MWQCNHTQPQLLSKSTKYIKDTSCVADLRLNHSWSLWHHMKLASCFCECFLRLIYKYWMFMSAMVQIFSWGERWNVPFNEANLFYITCTKIQVF